MKVNQFDPFLGKEEIASVSETIANNWITEGKKTKKFQEMLQNYFNVKYVVFAPNGTLSLYMALMVLGVGPGDEVIVPAFTFVGSATSIALTGAKPVFADINLDDFNLSIESMEKCLSKKTKAIMPVHIYGQSARMNQIMRFARKHKLKVVEDAAQGIGVTCGQKHVGTVGDIGCMSFYADKTITTGEGGALLTNNKKLAEKLMYFRNQGRLKRGSFVHPYVGFNYRITDLQAAIGVIQMKRLAFIIRKKKENEKLYKRLLIGVSQVEFPVDTKVGKRVPFRINILVDDPKALGDFLAKKNVGIRRFFYPLYRQPCFNKTNSRKLRSYKNSDKIFSRGLSLPSGVGLTQKQIKYVCGSIKEYYGRK